MRPTRTCKDYLEAAKQAGDFKMGGAQSKDTDETLTRMIEKTARVKFIYIPFKSGAEAAVQLAGGHIDSHVNNPSESIGQWKGGTQRPLCVFSPQRLPDGPKVTATQSWHDIPTCVESRPRHSALFQQPRTVWLPGKRDAGPGRLLCRPDEEGAGDAGMEGIYRAQRRRPTLPDRRCTSASSSTRTSSATARSPPSRAGWSPTSTFGADGAAGRSSGSGAFRSAHRRDHPGVRRRRRRVEPRQSASAGTAPASSPAPFR